MTTNKKTIARLYTQFQPTHYNLLLDINRRRKSIKGKAVISGQAEHHQVILHQKNLAINQVMLDHQPVPFTLDDEAETVTIQLPHSGLVNLELSYQTALTDTMMGIYPSYFEQGGRKKQIVSTQFETTFARQAFPCVDEPEAKARFDLAVKFDEAPGEIILANMPEVKTEDGIHYFATTARMSTYLLAFAFGALHGKQTQTANGTLVGVYSTQAHDKSELDFALAIASQTIAFFEDYFQTSYPLPVSNQLALPDFSAGAMENWGLITYREALLLVDSDNTSLADQKQVALTIAHELAHQWFGDLVTMKWWDDLWLNESFANMMQYVAIDALKPDWHIWETFQTSEVPAALERDATDQVQPVHVDLANPGEIDALFDPAIVYAKGARLLVMMRSLIGDAALRAGLKSYFAQHAYQNAEGVDLWQALSATSGTDIGALMTSWLNQPGYPVVTATLNKDELSLTQNQFFIGPGTDQGRQWPIPLASNDDTLPTLLTNRQVTRPDFHSWRKASGKPLFLNHNASGHFIVNYDDELLTDLLKSETSLTPQTQLQLLQDIKLLVISGVKSYEKLIPLLNHFANSRSVAVITTLYQSAYHLREFAQFQGESEQVLKHFYHQISQQQVARLGWTAQAQEPADDRLMRPIILAAALYGENPAVSAEGHQLFSQTHNLNQLPAAIRAVILRNEVRHYETPELIRHLLHDYQVSTDAAYKRDLTVALCESQSLSTMTMLMNYFRDPAVIKPQDLMHWFFQALNNPVSEQANWDWLRANWDWLEATLGGDMEFTGYINIIASIFKTSSRLKEFEAFFVPKRAQAELTREINMGITTITARVNRITDHQEEVLTALKKISA